MTNKNQQALKPGQIRLDFISMDWPLTPLGARKDPYVQGWQGRPFGLKEIEEEIPKYIFLYFIFFSKHKQNL